MEGAKTIFILVLQVYFRLAHCVVVVVVFCISVFCCSVYNNNNNNNNNNGISGSISTGWLFACPMLTKFTVIKD